MQFEAIKELVQQDFQAVDAQIIQSLHSKASIINDLGRYIIQSGGKRLRPLVLLLVARALGYSDKDHIQLASIVELIHTATLLHDDVVDRSELRRGRQTANQIYGNEAAVLVGDFLYSKAFQLMLKFATPVMMEVLAETINVMAEGEALQLMERHKPDTTEGNYLTVIRAKTAKLFEAAALLGAWLAQGDEKQRKAMGRFGLHLGTAFQLMDDLLDYHANPLETGKKLGNDLAEGKITLPLIYVLQNGSSEEVRLVRQAVQLGNTDYLPDIQRIIETSGALQYTMRFVRVETDRALKELEYLPETIYCEGLKFLGQFALERTK